MNQENKEYRDRNLHNGQSLISPFDSEESRYETKIRLGILASGNGSNFEYIVKAIRKKKLNAEISILIVNNPDCLAIKKAIKYEIPY